MSTQEGLGSTPGAGRLEEKGRELGRRADELGARVQTNLRDKASEVGAAKDHFMDRVHDGRARVEQGMLDHPMRSLVYAFAAGALVGLFLSRRGRS
jgi:ElaB/YqjD/DUF883 family membrane-anchored ribosome-binding protein